MKTFITVILLLTCCLPNLLAQELQPIRLTGVILTAENREALPYVNVRIAGTMYGTATDNTGYFSLFLNSGDTLLFTSIGYKDASFIMPYQLESRQYSLVQLMLSETKILKEIEVFAWPSMDNFKRAFLETQVSDKDEELIREVQREVKKDMEDNLAYEYYYDQMRYNKLYQLHGIIPTNNFLNPMRWSNFIQDLKEGKVSNKKK